MDIWVVLSRADTPDTYEIPLSAYDSEADAIAEAERLESKYPTTVYGYGTVCIELKRRK